MYDELLQRNHKKMNLQKTQTLLVYRELEFIPMLEKQNSGIVFFQRITLILR